MKAVSIMERTNRTYCAKVTGRHAITLPAELCRELDIAVGDFVELEQIGGQAVLRRAAEKPAPRLEGLLRDYFKDQEDIHRFLEEERQGWEEREARLDELWKRAEDRNGT